MESTWCHAASVTYSAGVVLTPGGFASRRWEREGGAHGCIWCLGRKRANAKAIATPDSHPERPKGAKDLVIQMSGRLAVNFDLAACQRDSSLSPFAQNDTCLLLLTSTLPSL